MASAHLNAQIVSRGSGHSAVAKAAYNARERLDDARTGERHDFTRHHSKCLFQGIYAPKGAPEWAHDRTQLWNHVEAFERHRRAELAQDVNMALPHELTLEQNRWLLQDWVRENATRKGLIADVAIHAPDRRGDARNIHAHVMIVRRKLDGSEFIRAKERFDTYGEKEAAKKADLAAMRESWGNLVNRHLERHGHEARIDMGRKVDGEATLHMGRHATAQERRGQASELGDRNREITAANENRKQRLAELAASDKTLGAEVRRAERDEAARRQIRADLDRHRADQAGKGRNAPETGRGQAETVRQARPTAEPSDRFPGLYTDRGQAARSDRAAQALADRQRRARANDVGRAAGQGAGMAAKGAAKAAGGLLGIVAGVLGGLAAAGSPAAPQAPQKEQDQPRRTLADRAREAQAKEAADAKAKQPEKDRDRDEGRSRFEAHPVIRFLAVVAGGDVSWIDRAKRRLIDYSSRTGARVVDQLVELDRIRFRILWGPA